MNATPVAEEKAEDKVDGRTARRERGRQAVLDAVFALLQEGHCPPPTDAIIERAGVSAASVFRYFDSVDDLLEQTIGRYFEHFAPLFEVPDLGEGSLAARIDALVDARLELYEAIAPIARLARARAPEHERLARTLHDSRAGFATQVRQQFGGDDDLVDLISVLTSFEAWDLLRAGHDRTTAQIRRAWIGGLTALLAA